MSSSYKVEMGFELFKKYVSSSMMICYRSVARHPFLVSMVFLLIWMQRLFPLFFSFLVSSSPVIVSTAVLLGTLLSYGQPNIPEIEKEHKSEQYEIRKLESQVMSQTEIAGRDGNIAFEETNGSRIEVGDKSFEVFNSVNEDNSCVEVDKPLDLVDDGEFVTEVNSGKLQVEEEHLVDEAKNETDEVKVVLGSHYSPLKQSEDEHIVLENDDKLWEGSADPLNSDPALLWKRVEGDGYDDDEDDDDDDDDDDDSGSDLAESSSPDASMADIIPMLDELHPLLSEEQEIRQEHDHEDGIENHEDSEHSLESSGSSSSSESNDEDDVKAHEDLEAGDEEDEDEEDKESKHTDKEDEPRSAITWTEDDQKNLMNLGTSEMERNRRLENLIARRRARKTMRMQAEKNLIDLETADLPWNISPISTARSNPFDYDSNDNIPGSAPSVLLKRRNPFDLPYDSNEEKPDLVGDTFQQELTGFQPKEPFFRRHESFNVGPSNFGAMRNERQETKLRPYFVPERSFQRQFSGISDSKASSVPDTESVSSADENKDHEDDHSLEPEVVSEKDQELISESHERPYFVPEHVASSVVYERQLSEVSDSKLSSISSASDNLENKDHIEEDDHSLEPELVSEKDEDHEHAELTSASQPYFVAEQVDSVGTGFLSYERQVSEVSDSKLSSIPDTESDSSAGDLENKDHIDLSQEPELISFEDDDNVESIQVPEGNERLVEAEISVGNVTNQQVVSSMELVSEPIHLNLDDQESHSSASSSSNELSEQIYNEKEGDEVATSVSETGYYFEEHGSLMERSEIDVTGLSLEVNRSKEPVYDMSPRSVTRNLSSSSVSNDLQADVSERVQSLPTSEGTSSFSGRESQETVPNMEVDCPEADDVGSRSIADHDLNELKLNLEPSMMEDEDHLHKDESFQHNDEQHQPLSAEDVLDMNASQELEKVEVPSSNSNGRSHESTQQEEVISQPEEEPSLDKPLVEDLEEVQKEFLLHTSADEASEENPEVLLQEQITSNNLDNLQFQDQRDDDDDDISLNNNSVLNAEPDVVEVVGIHSTESNNVPDDIDDVDEINEFDEHLLVELDAVGDFSVNDSVSTFNEMEEDPHVLETKHSADEDSCSKDLGSVLNEMEQQPLSLEHLLETKHSGDEDSYSKDLESNLNEMEEDPHASDHNLETKPSADEDSHSKDLDLEQHPDSLEHDLETKHSGDEDSSSKDLGVTFDEIKQVPHDMDHDIETKDSGDEDFCSKDLGSTLDEMKQDSHGLDHHDLETKISGDEDSYSKDLESTLNETEGHHHGLETFYSVDEYAFSKIVESTLNEMKYEPEALEHVLETNPSGDEDLYPINHPKIELKMDEEEVINSQNEKEGSNTEVAGGHEAEAIKTSNMDKE